MDFSTYRPSFHERKSFFDLQGISQTSTTSGEKEFVVKRPLFSIIIPTYNRKEGLKRCLQSLESQTYDHRQFEVILVDDGSDVPVKTWGLNNKASLKLQVLSMMHGGPSRARNSGAEVAEGEFLVFFEDDIIVDQNHLENASRHIVDDTLDVLEGTTVIGEARSDVRRFDSEDFYSFIPCNLIVRRSLFNDLGGYDPEFFDPKTGLYFREDGDFGFRLLNVGARIRKCSDLIVEHPEQFHSVNLCLRHARRYYFDPLLYKKHPFLYRRYIENKNIAGIHFRRPLHKLSLSMLLSVLLVVAGFTVPWYTVSMIGCAGIALTGFLVQYKYKHTIKNIRVHQTGIFILLPMIYLYALMKGCFHFRSFGCLF
jgi:glycosyltransferase involved in cell wall biosynthesis